MPKPKRPERKVELKAPMPTPNGLELVQLPLRVDAVGEYLGDAPANLARAKYFTLTRDNLKHLGSMRPQLRNLSVKSFVTERDTLSVPQLTFARDPLEWVDELIAQVPELTLLRDVLAALNEAEADPAFLEAVGEWLRQAQAAPAANPESN
jgi:hypothetical protein